MERNGRGKGLIVVTVVTTSELAVFLLGAVFFFLAENSTDSLWLLALRSPFIILKLARGKRHAAPKTKSLLSQIDT